MTVAPFESLAELRAEHGRLLKEGNAATRSPEQSKQLPQRVVEFLARVRSTGVWLDTPADREAAQSILDYWTATLFTLPKGTSAASALPSLVSGDSTDGINLQLSEFDSASIRKVAEAADKWLLELPLEQQTLAKKILMQLVRLPRGRHTFVLCTATCEQLMTLGPDAQIAKLLKDLEQINAVREADGAVQLRYESLPRIWSRYSGWLEKRKAFRETVLYWNQHQDEPEQQAALLSGELLREAETFHDATNDEKAFIAASRGLEIDCAKQDLFWKRVFMAVSAIAIVATVLAAWGWRRAATKRTQLVAEREANALNGAGQSTSTLAVAMLLMSESQGAAHSAKKLLIVQSLRQVLFARSKEAADTARSNWSLLATQLPKHDPDGSGRWIDVYLHGTHDNYIQDDETGRRICGRKEDIDLIISGATSQATPSRRQIDALREISRDLKTWIFTAQEPQQAALRIVRPVVLDDACRITDHITKSARNGAHLDKIDAFRLAFWRIESGGLTIIADKDIQEPVNQFADNLRKWEDAGGRAPSQDIIEGFKTAAANLQLQRDRLNRK